MADLVGATALVSRIDAVSGERGRKVVAQRWQLLTVRYAKQLVRRKTGTLGRSIHPGELSARRATVVVSAHYARYIEEGTRPHLIRPVRARVLAWGGERRLSGNLRTGARPTSFARWVQHPGSRPYPFLLPGARRALDELDTSVFVLAWNQAA